MFPDRRGFLKSSLGGLALAAGGAGGMARAQAVFGKDQELVIAVVGHGFVGAGIRDGAQMATEQINAAGGLLGHKLRVRFEEADFDGKHVRAESINVASRVMSEEGLIAVIGHDTVEDALPAAIAYLRRGIPFIAPTITSAGLTLHGLPNLYATLPDNNEIAVQTARIAFDIGLRRSVILRDRGSGSLEVSLAYRDEAAVLGISVVEEHSLPAGSSPRDYMAGLQGLRFDHLLIIGSFDLQIALVKFVSQFGLTATCVLPSMTNVAYMREQIGRVVPRVLLPVLRDRAAPTPAQATWEREYVARFGTQPLDVALQGADAVGLLAEGLNRVGSVNLSELGRVLHGELAYNGVGGRMSFRRNGRIYTRLLGFASIRPTEVAYYMPGA
jgi:branched-chain amino acid transport system substrate-binding protein